MSDVKRAIGDVVKKGGGGGGGSPFSALSASECSTAAAAAATLHPFGNIDKDGRGEGSNRANGGSGTGTGKKIPTVRLELNLFEPTTDSFPEFNFSKLIHEEQKRRKKTQKKQTDRTGNGFLSDPEMDMDVERMAKELERKYGMGSDYASKGKSARPSKLDYYDRGAGYDEEDSFIDNSEAYDELIPQEVETVGGGFYINSGQLEFKQLSNFERPEDAQRMPKPKKRALSTTSESSDDEEAAGEKKKPSQSTAPAQQTQKQPVEKFSTAVENQQQNRPPSRDNDKAKVVPESGEPIAPEDEKSRLNGHVAKKQKIVMDNGATAAAGEPKSKASSGESGKEKANGVKGKSTTVASTATTTTTTNVQGLPTAASVDGSSKKEENGGVKELKTTTVKDMLRAKRDSLRKMEQEKKGRSSGSSRVSSSEAEEDGDGGGDEDEDEDEENGEGDDEDEEEEEEEDEYDEEEGGGSDKNSRESVSEVEIVSESESSHESEKDGATGAAARGKVTNGTVDGAAVPATAGGQQPPKERKPKDCKLPDDISDQLRADVESLKELARALSGNGKLNFFESKVADLLLRIDEGARASPGSSSIRNAVFRHLESQLSISRQSLQLKLKKIHIRKLENKTKSVLSKLEDIISYTMPAIVAKYELDCLKVNEMRAAQAASALPNGEKADGGGPPPNAATPQIRNPKKKYTWNDRSRNLLWELYGIRQQAFELARSRNQTEDEVLADFMRSKVVPLWPKGWIRYEDVQKELDRRKKALAKSTGSSSSVGVPNTVGKKASTTATVSPIVSPPGTTIDTALLLAGTGMNGMKAQDIYAPVRSSTPSGVRSTNSSKGGPDAEKVGSAGSNPTHRQSPTMQSGVSGGASISPNSSFKRTSDHSISNIMNSPPPPPAGAGADNPSAGAFPNPEVKQSPATPAASAVSPANRNHPPLPSPDRQRWNSREDDSDSSIEIIAEYNVPRTAAAGTPPLPFQSPMTGTTLPVQGTSPNLPILNKEKYKNLTVGRNKAAHGGSSAGSSPITMGDIVSPVMGGGKFAKHSPGGGVIGFAPPPSGNAVGGPPELGGEGAGSVRQKDTPPSSIDVDVHQIMKDLKEYQKQHNAGGNRKSDSTTALQSQQQHVAATAAAAAAAATASSTTVPPAAASSNAVADYFIDCDMDDDDILFATNYTYTGGHKN
ncbi:ubinuclein-1 isoform X2 [Anopheles stephensi]|uniref:ubinuclein-1 isoform X2 n=1 Tax=Anopheles stephensi TaxID=30069 RepID=UPI00165881CE|nr:ubinuclein-1 isoform X2 [Anopheles stephensi]